MVFMWQKFVLNVKNCASNWQAMCLSPKSIVWGADMKTTYLTFKDFELQNSLNFLSLESYRTGCCTWDPWALESSYIPMCHPVVFMCSLSCLGFLVILLNTVPVYHLSSVLSTFSRANDRPPKSLSFYASVHINELPSIAGVTKLGWWFCVQRSLLFLCTSFICC